MPRYSPLSDTPRVIGGIGTQQYFLANMSGALSDGMPVSVGLDERSFRGGLWYQAVRWLRAESADRRRPYLERASVDGVEMTVWRIFTDWSIGVPQGEFGSVDVARKRLVINLHNKVVNECVQLLGGHGYRTKNILTACAFIDAPIARIASGAAKVMKRIVGRDLFSDKR